MRGEEGSEDCKRLEGDGGKVGGEKQDSEKEEEKSEAHSTAGASCLFVVICTSHACHVTHQ